ncbi:hypothetical protein N7468_006882 [Penicillium chermesinum]|uniref:Uncharacterized protein n=1 Tax=Penicillium chermesinum TaxID=63820 RepID=A0A9W9NT13_9EURO|nr:uncharacterized protein N7468_006882 [Penicillium chermesinum]KAJ5225657.1 hypothetical protein N7468_006882 [Penicillium chermesinum]KAJ6161124.1 hypothetical protein N7470_004520 [Penicillium chermesinum]
MSRYASAHANPKGPGDARPTALQIIQDESMEGKLAGKVVVITGGNSGIGLETVRALAATGAFIYVTTRDVPRAKASLGDIYQPKQVKLVHMDQSSLASVREAAKSILREVNKISILINNAGIMDVPELRHSRDGYELQFATNHLAHFLLFQLLKPALLAASTPEFQSRVVMVSSSGHRTRGINASDDYHYQKGGYDPQLAYAQSKTANVYLANEIERRYGSQGLHATSVHPGIVKTNIARFWPDEKIQGLMQIPQVLSYAKSPEQGAATTVWAAVGHEWEGRGGRYLAECAETEKGPEAGDMGVPPNLYVSHTYKPDDEARLWRDSLEMVGLPKEE